RILGEGRLAVGAAERVALAVIRHLYRRFFHGEVFARHRALRGRSHRELGHRGIVADLARRRGGRRRRRRGGLRRRRGGRRALLVASAERKGEKRAQQ